MLRAGELSSAEGEREGERRPWLAPLLLAAAPPSPPACPGACQPSLDQGRSLFGGKASESWKREVAGAGRTGGGGADVSTRGGEGAERERPYCGAG